MKKTGTSQQIQQAYDEQYDDRMTLWRELGAKYKAQNIITVTDGREFPKVLDFGAGEGSILKFLNEHEPFHKLHAVEISDSGITQIKKKKLDKLETVKKFDGYQTPYSDDEFGLAYCSHVIEHVEHPRLVLREIKRISKHQVFEIPLDYSKEVDTKLDYFLAYGHINIYTPSLFKFLLKSEGFEILEELHTDTAKKVIEFNWYKNRNIKRSPVRQVLATLASNKFTIARQLLGKKSAAERYPAAYTCFTQDSGTKNIF